MQVRKNFSSHWSKAYQTFSVQEKIFAAYQELVVFYTYVAVETCPDIAHAVNLLS